MSWWDQWDSSGFTGLASSAANALKTAQKKIDKALEISEEDRSKLQAQQQQQSKDAFFDAYFDPDGATMAFSADNSAASGDSAKSSTEGDLEKSSSGHMSVDLVASPSDDNKVDDTHQLNTSEDLPSFDDVTTDLTSRLLANEDEQLALTSSGWSEMDISESYISRQSGKDDDDEPSCSESRTIELATEISPVESITASSSSDERGHMATSVDSEDQVTPVRRSQNNSLCSDGTEVTLSGGATGSIDGLSDSNRTITDEDMRQLQLSGGRHCILNTLVK